MKSLSRRSFLRLSGAAAAGALASACGAAAEPAPAAQETPLPAATATAAAPAPTLAPSATPDLPSDTPSAAPAGRSYRRPEVIKISPAVKSKVVQVRDAGAWKGQAVDPIVLRQMVDKAVMSLTGLGEAKAAWQSLFLPEEKVAIKVNAFGNSTIWTHPELVKAVTDGLQEAGIPGGQIVIFDSSTSELETAKFPVNKDGPGVRCFGNDGAFANSYELPNNNSVRLSDVLTGCDALINMPVLKSHMIAGFTFALKNHYGSVSYPDGLHNIETSLPPLNALAPIRETTRLVIGDVLHANTRFSNSWPYWEADVRSDSILASYDPLAHDLVGLELLKKLADQKGSPTAGILGMSEAWIRAAGQAGLGAPNLEEIEWAVI